MKSRRLSESPTNKPQHKERTDMSSGSQSALMTAL